MKTITIGSVDLVSALQLDPAGTRAGWQHSRPVFLVGFKDGSKLVVKAESKGMLGKITEKSVQWGGQMMKQVSAPIDAVPVSSEEMVALRGLYISKYCLGQIGIRTREYMIDLLESGVFAFFKLPYVENLRGLDSMLAKNRGAKVLSRMKNDRKVIVGLGQIVAVDLFNGNHDRFGPDGRLVNSGNVMFQKNADRTYTPVGLDFFEAQGEASNLFTAPPQGWAAARLLPANSTHADVQGFSANAIDSLNEAFSNALAGAITARELMSAICIGRFMNGLREGSRTLRLFLQDRQTTGVRLPSGVMKRMEILGWV